jgi:streptomycin 6-kinase
MRLDQALLRFDLSHPQALAQTATSTLWTVRRPGGETAVLKLLRPGQAEEARGATYLQTLAGRGAVRVYAREDTAILMEHCPGPSLGDLSRAGRDAEATEAMRSVIQTLHAARRDTEGLQPPASLR